MNRSILIIMIIVKSFNLGGAMTKEDIITKASMLLMKIKVYSPAKYYKHICRFFDSTRYDMELHIKIINNSQYSLFAYERGALVYEYRTKNVDEIIFSVVNNIIGIMVQDETDRLCADENGALYYTDEVRNYSKALEDLYFSMIGGIYNEMHKQGKSAML